MSLILINREAEPGEINVPREKVIYLEVQSTGADDVDNASTDVFVNGVLAYDGGTFQAGFNGINSLSFSPVAGTRQIRIDTTTDFSTEEIVTVRVVSKTIVVTDPLFAIDESYSFTIEDFATPTVSSAFSLNCKTVKIKFSESMRAINKANADDALNPANYTITRNNADTIAAVNPTILSVVSVAPDEYDVSTNIEMSFGIPYKISVLNAEDISGNAITVPLNVASFIAFTPTIPAGRNFNLYNFFAAMNRREDATKDLLRFTSIIQDVINVLLFDIDSWTEILDFRIAPEPFVDAILCGMGNPFAFDLTLSDKRRLADVLISVYKKKGLAEGIEEVVLFFLGLTITVQPCVPATGWVLGESTIGETTILGTSSAALIYSFEIVSPIILTQDQRDSITKIANYMKPAHTHLKIIIEPTAVGVIDHWEMGLSELGNTTVLH